MYGRSFRQGRAFPRTCTTFLVFAAVLPLAHAATLHGRVRDPLGRAVRATITVFHDGKPRGSSASDDRGTYAVSAGSGAVILCATAPGFREQCSEPAYLSEKDDLGQDLTMRLAERRDDVTVTATGLPTPLEQTSVAVTLIPDDQLSTRAVITDELRLQPGVSVVQSGGYGGVTSLFVRGGDSTANQVLIDGVPAGDVGGRFDFSNVGTTAVSGLESQRGPNSVLYGSDALAGTVRFATARAGARPVLIYSGDAGNLHTWRNEAEVSGSLRRLDGFAAVSRFDSSNALPNDRYHLLTAAANVGVQIAHDTFLRGTLRNGASATGVPGPFLFYGVAPNARQADQDIYMSGVFESTLHSNLHQAARYLGARKREQYLESGPVGTPITVGSGPFAFAAYFGNVVTIRGANGTSATGRAQLLNGTNDRSDSVSNRDGVQYDADYRFSEHLSGLAGFRFQQERGSYRYPVYGIVQSAERRDYLYTLQLQGDVAHRIFYSLGGALQRNSLYGTEATPRIGVAGYLVRPGTGWFQGTRLHVNFSKGVQQPNLGTELSSLYSQLQAVGKTAAIAQYGVSRIGALRSRTYEGGIEQSLAGQKLLLRASYFHNEFGRQIEYVSGGDLQQYFGLPLNGILGDPYAGAYLNSLDFSAQGVESQVEFSPRRHLFFRGGHTWLQSRVQRSFSGDVTAAMGGFANTNPNFPDVPIGSSSPLIGARPFRRAPHTGFAVAEYSSARWSAGLKAAFSSRSDDSTFLSYASLAGDNSLLLPNRNLAFGFARLDANATWQLRPHLALFTQADNLLGQTKIGPIGYASLPFHFRVGVKLRIARE